jgi:hypothetical protein
MTITLRGEPERVIRCHCQYCQRRTGNVFQVSARFFEDQIVSRTGETRVFNDSENNPGVIDYTFCGRCGSTVYWPIKPFPGLYGVAVGCFADETFPKPNLELNAKYQHVWIQDFEGVDSFEEFAPFERMEPRRESGS